MGMVGDKRSATAQKLPRSPPAPSTGLQWAAVLCTPCSSSICKTRVTAQRPLSLLPPALVQQPSLWEVSEEAMHPQGHGWLHPGQTSNPAMTQLELRSVPLGLVVTEQAFEHTGGLGPDARWPCPPNVRCLLVPQPSLGHLRSWAWGTFCLWVSHQNLTTFLNMGYLLNDFLPVFL